VLHIQHSVIAAGTKVHCARAQQIQDSTLVRELNAALATANRRSAAALESSVASAHLRFGS
jgi:hypothetical protein